MDEWTNFLIAILNASSSVIAEVHQEKMFDLDFKADKFLSNYSRVINDTQLLYAQGEATKEKPGITIQYLCMEVGLRQQHESNNKPLIQKGNSSSRTTKLKNPVATLVQSLKRRVLNVGTCEKLEHSQKHKMSIKLRLSNW